MNPAHTAETDRIRREVIRLDLYGADAVIAMSLSDLATAYNGCGPESLPEAARQALDKITSTFSPAFMVHDVDFTLANGLKAAFDAANKRLLLNCVKCALDAAPWTSWKRYAMLSEAWAIYRACDKFGWAAWLSAYNKNQTKES